MAPGYKKELEQVIELKMMRRLIGRLDQLSKMNDLKGSIPKEQIRDMIREMRKDIESNVNTINNILIEQL